ncbi:hypothetical protein CC79DRAFT_1358659 [Sarocladium strictum]
MTEMKQDLPPASRHTVILSPGSPSSPLPPIDLDDPTVQHVHDSIAAAASRNTDLLRELTQTADAPGLYTNNETTSRHAQKRLKQQQDEVVIAKAASQLQFNKHKKFQGSGPRKLYYVILRKRMHFDERASAEEKLYLQALERRHRAETVLSELQDEVNSLTLEGRSLRAKLDRHGAAHKAIDQLYASIFDGPTPGFPHEDAQEGRHIDATEEHQQAMKKTQATVKGRKNAAAIAGVIERAAREAKIAVDESNGRGLIAVIGHRLKRCVAHLDLAKGLNNKVLVGLSEPIWPALSQAKESLDSILNHVKSLPIHHWTDRNTTQDTASQLHRLLSEDASGAQVRLLETVIAASEAQRSRVRGTATSLENARQDLQQIRQRAFEQTVGFGEAAPAYNECCNRAAGYEAEVDEMCARITDVVVDELPEVVLMTDLLPPGYEQVLETTRESEEQIGTCSDRETGEAGTGRQVIHRRAVPFSTNTGAQS